MLQLQGVSKSYGRRRGICTVDLETWYGEIFGYLGPNGAGKTTTIRLILDLIRPDSGRIGVLGLDARRNGTEIRRRIGYLPGELSLYENLTVEESLRFFSRLHRRGDGRDGFELAERLRCPLAAKIASLSSGNKRKVGLVQALAGRPQLLILDEPTNGLDPIIRHELYGILAEARGRGQTVFLSSHDLPEVERVCDRVGIIRAGRIAAVEKVADLRARSLRSVEVRFHSTPPFERLSALANVRVVSASARELKLEVRGEIEPLLAALSGHRVEDLISQVPSLEEVFLAYYGESIGAE